MTASLNRRIYEEIKDGKRFHFNHLSSTTSYEKLLVAHFKETNTSVAFGLHENYVSIGLQLSQGRDRWWQLLSLKTHNKWLIDAFLNFLHSSLQLNANPSHHHSLDSILSKIGKCAPFKHPKMIFCDLPSRWHGPSSQLLIGPGHLDHLWVSLHRWLRLCHLILQRLLFFQGIAGRHTRIAFFSV